jgi:hypothetical protein
MTNGKMDDGKGETEKKQVHLKDDATSGGEVIYIYTWGKERERKERKTKGQNCMVHGSEQH